MSKQRFSLSVPASLWLLSVSLAFAQSQTADDRARSDNRVETAAPHGQLYFFGIVGEVARPAVYAGTETSPLLIDIVRQAGQLTDQATGSVRIIRQGNAGQQVFLRPQLDVRLMPGDVLIVDGRRQAQDAASKRHGTYPPQNTSHGPDDENPYIQLAFVNLGDRPVVSSYFRNQATLPRIISDLRQPTEILSSVMVVSGSGGQFSVGADLENARLPSASVLIFDPRVLKLDRVPELPPYVLIEDSRPSGPELPADAEAVRLVDNTPAGAPPAGMNHPTVEDASEGPTIGGPVFAGVADSSVSVAGISPAHADPRWPEQLADLGNLESPFYDSTLTGAVNAAADVTAAKASAERDATPAEPTSTSETVLAVTLAGSLAASILFVILWIKARRMLRMTPQPDTLRLAPQSTRVLDALINNEFEIVEQPLKLSSSLRFYGQPAAQPRIRVDRGEEHLRGPHYRPDTIPVAGRQGGPVGVAEDDSDATRGARPASASPRTTHRPRKPQQPSHAAHTTAGLLDRALSAAHGALNR